ncbi:hypothetical protein SAMD00019534_045710, partial [Acytostelium subglobosum LB1]|uniref:hypothetical protein n=1 Tax=Acytostelium subglobosum LB1 TaxID=1410327 RepID=UPI0006450552
MLLKSTITKDLNNRLFYWTSSTVTQQLQNDNGASADNTTTSTTTTTTTTNTPSSDVITTIYNTAIPLIATPTTKMGGYQFFRDVLKSPKHIVAPMIDHTFLAFRMLCRKYNADLVYTPMFHSKNYANDATYRLENFEICKEDRPLVVQFCGNEVEHIVKAALMVESQCDAVDINLGCPQIVAKKGHYGAFLLEQPEIVLPMVRELHKRLSIPVFCKIRLLPNLEDTIKLALQLQEAGCQLLTVHGRTKEQKGKLSGVANWKAIKAVKDALSIPVIANGSVLEYDDIDECLKETTADGVMSAEGILANPAMFSGKNIPVTQICHDFLDMCEQYPTQHWIIRSHFFKLLRKDCEVYEDLRSKLNNVFTVAEFRGVLVELEQRHREGVPAIKQMTNKEKRELLAKQKLLEQEAIAAAAAAASVSSTDSSSTNTHQA